MNENIGGQQFTNTPWGYRHHMTARDIIEGGYKFMEGDLDWKTKSAFHEPLEWADGTTEPSPRSDYDETVLKHTHPGWTGHLGELIQKNGFVEDPSDPIHIVEDHPEHGKVIYEGQHRIAAMYRLHPDQVIPVIRSNYAYALKAAEDSKNDAVKQEDGTYLFKRDHSILRNLKFQEEMKKFKGFLGKKES